MNNFCLRIHVISLVLSSGRVMSLLALCKTLFDLILIYRQKKRFDLNLKNAYWFMVF